MTSKPIRSATITSKNIHNLDFPYQGGTNGTVSLRQHPRYGKDVIFTINKGQLLCHSYDGCDVTVRFDDHPVIKIKANEPSDHNSTTLFLSGYNSLISKIRKSSKMIVEVEFFRQGIRSFEFDISNLEWK